MTVIAAVLNLALGIAYCGYGVMTAVEMKRDWKSFGFSHFGLAWIFMAFTCGPHHLFHGVHLLTSGRAGQPFDVLAVVVGLPVGVTWLYLRVEAFAGGRGDRFVVGTPAWLRAAPVGAAAYVLILATAATLWGSWVHVDSLVLANSLLLVIYIAIGWFILRTQFANRGPMAGWSVSGLCLSVIFPTCALMHAVWAAYDMAGRYHADLHGLAIDWLSVPAALYFLWVVRGLYRDTISDWNEGPGQVGQSPGVAPVGAPPVAPFAS